MGVGLVHTRQSEKVEVGVQQPERNFTKFHWQLGLIDVDISLGSPQRTRRDAPAVHCVTNEPQDVIRGEQCLHWHLAALVWLSRQAWKTVRLLQQAGGNSAGLLRLTKKPVPRNVLRQRKFERLITPVWGVATILSFPGAISPIERPACAESILATGHSKIGRNGAQQRHAHVLCRQVSLFWGHRDDIFACVA